MQFACDYCGSLISLKDKSCSHCGSVFAFVRCSKCDYSGETSEFRRGCPKCGSQDIITNKSGSNGLRSAEALTRNKCLWFWIFLAFMLGINVILFLYVGFSF